MFGVSLYSHAVPYFFEASAGELVDQLIELREMMRSDAEAIAHRLAGIHCFNKQVETMAQYLKGKFDPARKTDIAVIKAIKTIRELRGLVNIGTLAKESFLSQKQFERRFKNFSGFNPKLYARILRFGNSLTPYNRDTSFTSTALDLGYYDQAHFINDFRQFSGFTPGSYTPISY